MRQRYAGLGSVGLNTDVQPSLLEDAAWTVLNNVACEDGALRSAYGELRKYELPVRPRYYSTHRKLTGEWYIVTSDGSAVWLTPLEGTGASIDITPTTGPWPTSYVSFSNLNTKLVVNSEKAGAFYLDSTTDKLIPLPGWDPNWRCREMVAFRYYLVALGMTESTEVYAGRFLYSGAWALGAGWTETSQGVFAHTAGVEGLRQSTQIVAGKTYLCEYTITNRTAGSVTITFGGLTTGAVTATGSLTSVATNAASFLITPTTDFNGTITVRLRWQVSIGVYSANILATWSFPNGWEQDPEGTLHFTGSITNLTHSAASVVAKVYRCTYTVAGRSDGSASISFGGQTKSNITAGDSFSVTATSVTGFTVVPTATFNGVMTFSLQEETSPGVFGPELLLTAGWTVPTGWAQNPTGTFIRTPTANPNIHGQAPGTAGSNYRVNYTVTPSTGQTTVVGTVEFSMGGGTTGPVSSSGSILIGPTTTAAKPTLTPSVDFIGTVTVYVTEVLSTTTDKYPHKLRWSTSAEDGAVPSEWPATLENDAGDDLLGETPGHIVGGVLMRDALFVVKEDAAYTMNYVGGQFVMRVDRLHGSTGTPLQKGYVEMKGNLVICSTRDLVAFDGQTATSLAEGRVREALQDTISDSFWAATKVFRHNPTTTLWISGSSGTARLDSALVLNWSTGTWFKKLLNHSYGLLALPVAAGDKPLTEIAVLESDVSDTSWWASILAGADTNSDGTAKTCTAERVGLPIEGADGMAMVREAWLDADGTEPLEVTFGAQAHPDGTVTWGTPETWTPGVTQSLTPRLAGRFLAVRLKSTGTGWWKAGALTIDWTKQGLR